MNEEELQPSSHKSLQVTQVSNGFITEISHSSQPDQDGQERAAVHANLDELVEYISQKFQAN